MPRLAQLTTPSPKPLLSEIKAANSQTDQSSIDGCAKDARRRHQPTCHVGVTVVVQAAPGHRLAAKQRVAVKVVAELFQEAEDVRDAADSGQSQGVLLLVEVSWAGDRGRDQSGGHAHVVNRLSWDAVQDSLT